jgi:hypothetical protein
LTKENGYLKDFRKKYKQTNELEADERALEQFRQHSRADIEKFKGMK